ncbi:hypothetical protein HMPREF9406_1339 [Clostridium sp. HGF2]|nr:hypothetical protein HMPREF9406_1339 [Clostridium sp. HGF2]
MHYLQKHRRASEYGYQRYVSLVFCKYAQNLEVNRNTICCIFLFSFLNHYIFYSICDKIEKALEKER